MKSKRITDEALKRIYEQHMLRVGDPTYIYETDIGALLAEVFHLRAKLYRLGGDLDYVQENIEGVVAILLKRGAK